MVKRNTNLLLLVTAIFVAFTLGFFAGRNFSASPVQITALPAETHDTSLLMQAPAETEPVTEEAIAVSEVELTIPSSESTIMETEAPTEAPTEETSDLININSASVAQLVTLPGIGEVLAQRIVDYREANGPFPSVAALTNVSGIGEKKLAAIIHLVTV